LVIGPMLTAFGFRSWYWAARPTRLVAVPGGFWVAVAAAMPGASGGILGGLAEAPGRVKGSSLANRLLAATDDELIALPGAVVYPLDEMAAIVCKRFVLGTNPDFVVETKSGKRHKYGLANVFDFDGVLTALRGQYGEIVKA
jgi:hypothetical protein